MKVCVCVCVHTSGRRKDACWLGTAVRSVLNGCHLLTEGEAILKFLVSMAAPDTMYTVSINVRLYIF